MNVLIVGRTRMRGAARCIGGITAGGRAVRLLASNGGHWNTNAPFQIGEVWDITYNPIGSPVPPFVEDVVVSQYKRVGIQAGLAAHLLKTVRPWRGGIGKVFGGVLGFTSANNGYVSHRLGVPPISTGFWIPEADLVLRIDKKHYEYQDNLQLGGLSYVGEPSPVKILPAGTLVRVSLARWWKPQDADPDFEERCYLQLSGWF